MQTVKGSIKRFSLVLSTEWEKGVAVTFAKPPQLRAGFGYDWVLQIPGMGSLDLGSIMYKPEMLWGRDILFKVSCFVLTSGLVQIKPKLRTF